MTRLQVAPETTLRCGAVHAVLAPSAGGRISALFSDVPTNPGGRIDWLLPLNDGVRAGGFDSSAWPRAGLYPLVPYSNRIRHGRFEWDGCTVQLPLHPDEGHALHGVSQQRAWTLTQHSDTRATMTHDHRPGEGGWPWAYRVDHIVTVDDGGIALCLRVTNTGEVPAPCGGGFHPYFPIGFADRVGFAATTVWPPDAQFLATAPQALSQADDYSAPRRVADTERTQYYGGWDGHATLSALGGARIRLSASGTLRHLVLYRPAGRDFFCIEPVSHVADAANLAAQGHAGTGWQTLAPMQSLECRLRMALST